MTLFQENLERLGFKVYGDYLKSEHWFSFRKRCAVELPTKCPCGMTTNLNLHHKTYKRLGEEWLMDVIWLCEECHHKLHEILKEKKGSLWSGTNKLKRSPWFKSRRAKLSVFTPSPKKHNNKKKVRMNLDRFSSHELELILSYLPENCSESTRRIRVKISQKLGLTVA